MTTEIVPRPFYVGKGTRWRIRYRTRNKRHSHICNKYGYRRFIVFETDDESLAFALEIALIAEYGTFHPETGWGANFSRGGEGPSGWQVSTETRQKKSALLKGKKLSAETKKKLSERRQELLATGWKPTLNEDVKDKLSLFATERERKKRESGHQVSDATRKKLSEAQKRRWEREHSKCG
jgi:hypothetical protein